MRSSSMRPSVFSKAVDTLRTRTQLSDLDGGDLTVCGVASDSYFVSQRRTSVIPVIFTKTSVAITMRCLVRKLTVKPLQSSCVMTEQ